MSRYWFDSFPGFSGDDAHVVLDYYRTPYGGMESTLHTRAGRVVTAFDGIRDPRAPYTTVSQNRGGPS